MATFPPVVGYRNTIDELEEQDMNRPINALTQRTEWLKNRLEIVAGTRPFESVRLSDVGLSTTNVPIVNDFVYLEPDTGFLAPAIAEAIPSAIEAYASASNASYAVGILVATGTAGTGTAVTYGYLDLSTTLLSGLIEPGEVFRDGPYYLSTAHPGKMTAVARGPAIYLGYFLEDKNNPGYGNFAILAPQVRDIWQAHLHYNFPLSAQPAGDNEPTGTTPSDVHYIRGIKPDDYQPGGGSVGEPPIRALVVGDWVGNGSVTYTIWVTTTDDTLSGALVHWSTSDGSDDTGGSAGVRLPAFNVPVAIGSKGLYFVLEKGGAYSTYTGSADFDALVTIAVAQVERQWTIVVPERVTGWQQKWVRELNSYTGSTPTTETQVAMYLFGRFVNPDERTFDQISVEVTNAGGHFSAGTVDLDVKDRYGTVIASFSNVAYGGPALAVVNGGNWDLWLVVSKYDASGNPVVDDVGGLQTTDSWEFQFQDEAPGAAFEYTVDFDANLDTYYPPRPLTAVVLENNGVAMDQFGVFRDGEGTYTPTLRTVFWYPDDYARVPFPRDWQTMALPGSTEYQINSMLYFNRMAMAAAGIVTSIKASSESSLRIVDAATGQPAIIGDLEIQGDLTFLVEDTGEAGYSVAKSVGDNGKLQFGPVVEKVLPGPGLYVRNFGGAPEGQGTVEIGYDGDGLGSGNFEDITLLNAKQEVVPNKIYSFIKLLDWDSAAANNIETAFQAQFRVPPSLSGNYRALLYFTVFGLEKIDTGVNVSNTQWAGLTMDYSIIRDLTLSGTPAYVDDTLLGANQVSYQLPTDVPFGRLAGSTVPGVAYRAYDPILLHNDPDLTPIEGQIADPFMGSGIPTASDVSGGTFSLLAAGDLVAIKLRRSTPTLAHQGGSKEYKPSIGFINLRWKLVGA
jgi:hypothetical protein